MIVSEEDNMESKAEKSFMACDKMEMLHRPEPRPMKKHGSLLRRQKLQVYVILIRIQAKNELILVRP